MVLTIGYGLEMELSRLSVIIIHHVFTFCFQIRRKTYRRMVAIVKPLVPNDTPDAILLDFEVVVRNAFRDGFPNADVEVAKLGLKQRYELISNLLRLSSVFLAYPLCH